jgi:arabinogalactan oligomer / maltooligosaccharide transport system permease protein
VTRAPSHRRRFLAGLVAALALGVGGAWLLLRGAHGDVAEEVRVRKAIVSTLALEDLVRRAEAGEAVRQVAAAWQSQQPPGGEARVLIFQGITLEASTSVKDAGELAAPRRLSREEKPLFDRGQRLRAAVASNQEGGASKPELEVEAGAGGRQRLAAPLERGGQVVGMVEVETSQRAEPQALDLGPALLAVALPLLGLWLVGRRLGERRWAQAGAAVAALAGGVVIFAAGAVPALRAARLGAHAEVAAHARAQAAQVSGLVATLRLEAQPPPAPAAWDADVYRRPRGFLLKDGSVDPARAGDDARGAAKDATGGLVAAGLAGLLALAAVGLGGTARIGRALVTHRQAYAYIAPAMLGTLVLVFFPFLYGVALSFTDSNIYNSSQPITDLWVGLKNYGAILGDFGLARRGADGALGFNYLNFYWTFLFTVIWTVTNVAFGVSFGLLLALALDVKGLRFRPIYRVLLILPWAMPNYITALIWKGMFHRQFGVVNHALALLGVEPLSWFDRPFTSFLTALCTNGWLSFPFMMVVSLGALQSIPADIYEAARVDGASRWQQFKAITLPSLKPALVPAVILSVVWTFNMFNIIYLVTGGAPDGATEILVTQAYKFAFEKYQYGYAAAYATVIFAILLVYGNVQNRVTRATEAI